VYIRSLSRSVRITSRIASRCSVTGQHTLEVLLPGDSAALICEKPLCSTENIAQWPAAISAVIHVIEWCRGLITGVSRIQCVRLLSSQGWQRMLVKHMLQSNSKALQVLSRCHGMYGLKFLSE